MRKEIIVKQYIDEKTGMTIIDLTCSICCFCPCKHVELNFNSIKIKSFPKEPKNKKRQKIRENLTLF